MIIAPLLLVLIYPRERDRAVDETPCGRRNPAVPSFGFALGENRSY